MGAGRKGPSEDITEKVIEESIHLALEGGRARPENREDEEEDGDAEEEWRRKRLYGHRRWVRD